MKKKVYLYLLSLGLLAVIMTLVSGILIFSAVLEKENMDELRARCLIFCELYEQEQNLAEIAQLLPAENRLTIIQNDGSVIYESISDLASDNHLNRPEIAAALATGEGNSRRNSTSMGCETYYYAFQADNGDIVRLSQDIQTQRVIYQKLLGYGVLLIMIVLVLAIVLAHYLTKRLVAPIEKMAEDLDNIEQYVPYPELAPFAHTVKLAQEQQKANEAQRRDFTANVSHELKTPLTSILGYSEMIETGLVKDDDIKMFAGKIRTEAERQLHLIGDIIQLSELDVKQVNEKFTEVDLYEVAETVSEYLSFAAESHGVSLGVSGEHLSVWGSKNLLEELVYNLCDNAIRYNVPQGKVQMTVTKKGENIAFVVSDTGIGIAPYEQSRIFERFYRVDKSRSRDSGGTGLGLAIVKHIAMQHEAEIFVKSLPEMGTTIEVVFKVREG